MAVRVRAKAVADVVFRACENRGVDHVANYVELADHDVVVAAHPVRHGADDWVVERIGPAGQSHHTRTVDRQMHASLADRGRADAQSVVAGPTKIGREQWAAVRQKPGHKQVAPAGPVGLPRRLGREVDGVGRADDRHHASRNVDVHRNVAIRTAQIGRGLQLGGARARWVEDRDEAVASAAGLRLPGAQCRQVAGVGAANDGHAGAHRIDVQAHGEFVARTAEVCRPNKLLSTWQARIDVGLAADVNPT